MSIKNENITILVADDVFTNIEFLRYILRKENYNILPVSNGAEALETIAENAIDLILLDVMMPDIDGFEVCRRLKEMDEYKDIPVIFLTARTDIESTVKGFELGAVDYITKPFHRQELLARVKNQIELQRSKDNTRKVHSHCDEKWETIQKNIESALTELEKTEPNIVQAKNLLSQILKLKDEQ